MPPTVFILDFGAQYSQLIARRTRELGVYCEIVPFDTPWAALSPRSPAAIVLSGGPESTLVAGAPGVDPAILAAGVPLLGICYGMQLLARDLGAELIKLDRAEYGPATLWVTDRTTPLFDDVPVHSRVWMSHGDSVVKLPEGFLALASTQRCNVAAMGDPARKDLRRAVPSGGRAHRSRTRGPAQLHVQNRGTGRRLADGFVRRRSDCGDPREGRRRQGDLRALRRRRLGGGGYARVARHRRATDLHLRRSRLVA